MPLLPAAVFAIQTYGDQLNFHPHLHSLVAERAWSRDDLTVQPVSRLDSDILTAIFLNRVLDTMVAKRRLSPAFSLTKSPTGATAAAFRSIADDHQALQRLTATLLRPSFAATGVRFGAHNGKVDCRTAKGLQRSMDVLDWIAQVVSHIPDPGQQMVRYYGWYSNASPLDLSSLPGADEDRWLGQDKGTGLFFATRETSPQSWDDRPDLSRFQLSQPLWIWPSRFEPGDSSNSAGTLNVSGPSIWPLTRQLISSSTVFSPPGNQTSRKERLKIS